MIEKSIPRVEQASGKALPKCCAQCGDTEKARMAPHPNARNYAGPMFCAGCNPRFSGADAMRALVTR